ncbi:MAG TPA: citramalate synthase, partial [Polyangiaceae bacterium]|nr:citramalate synthase [Polyangiaceae bacterium]
DPALQVLADCFAPVCTLVGKTWGLHLEKVVKVSREENLAMIGESIAFLVAAGKRALYDAEHFFDGYEDDREYAMACLRAAAQAGAETVVCCDTNGGTLPDRLSEVMASVVRSLQPTGVRVGIHCHDDAGCGVANTLAAVVAGATHVQGTINGYGERCGNANLSVIIPNLELKLGFRVLGAERLREVSELSHFVAEVANLSPDAHMAYVGKSAFAHKGGVHVAAMRRNAESYQHVAPELVGNTMRVVVSELSGRGNVLAKAEEMGLEVSAGTEVEALREIKEAEARGLSYEGAEASVALLLQRKADDYVPLFQVVDYQIQVGKRRGTETFAEAVVKVQVGGNTLHTAAEGNGPVSALDGALRKALSPHYPAVNDIHLADYKVRILDGTEGTEAITRVLIDSRDAHRTWSTVGASSNIIEASMHALVDSIEYGLIQSGSVLPEGQVDSRPRAGGRGTSTPPKTDETVEAGS